jgi:integrase
VHPCAAQDAGPPGPQWLRDHHNEDRPAWKPRYFKSQWEAASKDAGITDLHFHDLRGTVVTLLAEARCTTPQIAAITGHSLKTVTKILDKYLARTRVLAGEAVTLFENAKATKFANRLQTRTAKPSKGASK